MTRGPASFAATSGTAFCRCSAAAAVRPPGVCWCSQADTAPHRLFAHVERTDDCWIWTGAKNGSGAGVLHIREDARVRQLVAPRLSWELHFGPIPENYRVWHHCWQPACVRPDHLYLRRRLVRVPTTAPSHMDTA